MSSKNSKGEFWAMPKDIMGMKDVSLEARFVYAILWTRMNGENVAWPGQRYMAEMLGVSERSIIRYIQELEKAKLIEKIRSGQKRTNRYIICQVVTSRSDNPVTSGSDKGVTSSVREQSKRTVVVAQSAKWDWKEYLQKTRMEHPSRAGRIIGDYWEMKGYEFQTQEQASADFIRNLRPAKSLLPYEDDRIIEVMDWLTANAEFKWTLETVGKYINENLNNIKIKKPSPYGKNPSYSR